MVCRLSQGFYRVEALSAINKYVYVPWFLHLSFLNKHKITFLQFSSSVYQCEEITIQIFIKKYITLLINFHFTCTMKIMSKSIDTGEHSSHVSSPTLPLQSLSHSTWPFSTFPLLDVAPTFPLTLRNNTLKCFYLKMF